MGENFLDQILLLINAYFLEVCIGVGILVGALTSYLWQARKNKDVEVAAFEAGLQQSVGAHAMAVEGLRNEIEALQTKIIHADQKDVANQTSLDGLGVQLHNALEELNSHRDMLATTKADRAASQARLEEAQAGFKEREALFRESSKDLKKEFEHLATKVFESQEEKQKARLNTVLTPFKDQIVDFRKRVEEVYHTDTKERASLLTEIKNLQSASERINEEAENLTKALKGDKKLQGNWGELVLERVLEESGLRRDHEYFVQSAQRNEAGDLKRPDVLIRLPDDKDVVVDSKVSLNAYEEAVASEDDQARERLIKQHLTNLRNHVRRLSEQDYDRLPDVRSLDFVLLFIPIESAFTLAMEWDHRLFTDAFAQRIVIVSPTTLMMTLRIINNVWRYEKQNRNSQEIAKRAGALYDKLRGLVEDVDTLGKQLKTAEKTYDSVFAKLATGRGNLVRQVEHFRELGAQVKKPMDSKLIEQSDPEGD
ncbi:MAG: DNA recombination protein RmuC [Candidatus Azotimanducaceae bacterium]